MKTTAQLINSLLWPDEKYQYAVVNTRPDGSFLIVYSDEKPSFHSVFHFWVSSPPVKTTAMNGEETTDWKSAVITYEQWKAATAASPEEEPRLPQVGETWMTSNGPVEIVYVKKVRQNDSNHWRCCAEHKLGALNIYGLEELKPMPAEVMFTKAALSKLEEEPVDMQALLVDVAQLIIAGQLDAELAALGYTKTNQQ